MKAIFQKVLKYSLFVLVALFITINLFIVLSGRFYMYKGIAHTYLIGKVGPTIYDLNVSPYSTIHSAEVPLKSIKNERFNQFKLPPKYSALIEELETKAFLVLKNDTLIYEKYWGDHTEETVSNSFSVVKTLVAILVGVAIEDGDIKSIDDPVSLYLPEFMDKDDLTIRHLLEMASGLDWEESAKNPFSDNAESYYGSDLRRLVLGQSVESTPGKAFKYQSGNSQLLGYILEAATGSDLSEYAEAKVWRKIGAEHDAYWSLDKELGDEKAFCCMYATARDYAKLGKLLLNKGRLNNEQIIPSWYFSKMVTPQPLTTKEGIPNYRYGLHTWTYLDPAGKVNYCRGVNGQYIITIPSENLVIIRIGSKKMSSVTIPEEKLQDVDYIEQVKFQVGHSYGLFEYLALGKLISSER